MGRLLGVQQTDDAMSKQITWLHFSDIHLCKPKTGWDATRVLDALREDLHGMQKNHDLHPDFIFFTGDAAYGQLGVNGLSIQAQLEEAWLLFEEVRQAFTPEVPIERFFIVPGNHDVNRQVIRSSQTSWLDGLHDKEHAEAKQRITNMIRDRDGEWQGFMERLADYKAFIKTFDNKHLLEDLDRLIFGHVEDIRGVKVGIAGLNSAWSSARDKEKGKLWLAGHWQIRHLHEKIKEAHVKIALIHHPLNWLSDIEDPKIEPELESAFDFLLHGHQHQAWVSPRTRHVRIEAGACYDRSDEDKDNGYNFVRLDLEKGTGEVWLRRYESGGEGGWVSRVLPGYTDDKEGKWRLDIGWLKWGDETTSDEDAEQDVPPKPPEPEFTGPELRGVFGREKDIRKISNALAHKAIVAVYGLSGIGKSKVLEEVRRVPVHATRGYHHFFVYPNT